MREITLAGGQATLVDDDVYAELSHYTWRLSKGHVVRSYRNGSRSPVREFMHRRLCQVSPNLDVVHLNLNKLDNRRENLRAVTRGASTQHKGARGQSGLKGVGKNKSAFMAQISIDKKQLYIGRFADPIAAARAYDYAALMYYGPSARVNFGEPDPELLPEIVKERVHEFHRQRSREPAPQQPQDSSRGAEGDGENDLLRERKQVCG